MSLRPFKAVIIVSLLYEIRNTRLVTSMIKPTPPRKTLSDQAIILTQSSKIKKQTKIN